MLFDLTNDNVLQSSTVILWKRTTMLKMTGDNNESRAEQTSFDSSTAKSNHTNPKSKGRFSVHSTSIVDFFAANFMKFCESMTFIFNRISGRAVSLCKQNWCTNVILMKLILPPSSLTFPRLPLLDHLYKLPLPNKTMTI